MRYSVEEGVGEGEQIGGAALLEAGDVEEDDEREEGESQEEGVLGGDEDMRGHVGLLLFVVV